MENSTDKKMTGGEAIVKSLINEGVKTIFGLPGIQLDPMFNSLHESSNEIRVINARHEQAWRTWHLDMLSQPGNRECMQWFQVRGF